jgi:hypothetical protein
MVEGKERLMALCAKELAIGNICKIFAAGMCVINIRDFQITINVSTGFSVTF